MIYFLSGAFVGSLITFLVMTLIIYFGDKLDK